MRWGEQDGDRGAGEGRLQSCRSISRSMQTCTCNRGDAGPRDLLIYFHIFIMPFLQA